MEIDVYIIFVYPYKYKCIRMYIKQERERAIIYDRQYADLMLC